MLKMPANIIEREPLKMTKPALLRGVGLVIVAHARLELLLTELVYDLLRTDYKLGRQVLRGDNPKETFQIAMRLLKVWNITPPENLKRLKKDIDKAYAKRNEVAHGAWVRIKRNDVRIRLAKEERLTPVGSLDRRIMPEFAKRTISQFKADVSYINAVTARVIAIKKLISVQLKPWPSIDASRPPKHRTRPHRSGKAQPIQHQTAHP